MMKFPSAKPNCPLLEGQKIKHMITVSNVIAAIPMLLPLLPDRMPEGLNGINGQRGQDGCHPGQNADDFHAGPKLLPIAE